MTPVSTSHPLDTRRRRLAFRCWHRGTREMDLLLGRFADARLAGMSEREVDAFEELVEAPDGELFGWIVAGQPPAAGAVPELLAELRAFHSEHPTSLDG